MQIYLMTLLECSNDCEYKTFDCIAYIRVASYIVLFTQTNFIFQ